VHGITKTCQASLGQTAGAAVSTGDPWGCRSWGYLWAKQNAPDSLLSLGRLLISPPPSAARGLL